MTSPTPPEVQAHILDLATGTHPTNPTELDAAFTQARDAVQAALAPLRQAAIDRNALISDARQQSIDVGLDGEAGGTGAYGLDGGVMVDGESRQVLIPIAPEKVLGAALGEAVARMGLDGGVFPWSPSVDRFASRPSWRSALGRDLEAAA